MSFRYFGFENTCFRGLVTKLGNVSDLDIENFNFEFLCVEDLTTPFYKKRTL